MEKEVKYSESEVFSTIELFWDQTNNKEISFDQLVKWFNDNKKK